jgi:uncharacterized protein YjbI with pentapeptide repeats
MPKPTEPRSISYTIIFIFSLFGLLGLSSITAATAVQDCVPGPNKNLSYCDMRSFNVAGVSLENSNLTGTNWEGVNLAGVNFKNAVLSGANLNRTDLRGADLSGADIRGAYADFANFDGAILNLARTSNVGADGAILPQGWQTCSVHLVGPGADLTGANFDNANISGCDLSSSKLFAVVSKDVQNSASTRLPTGWILRKGFLLGPGVRLSNVDFRNSNFEGLSSTSTNFSNLTLPTGYSLVAGMIIGPNVDLSGAYLVGASLGGVNLEGVNLSDANLSGVTSGNVTGQPVALPKDWSVVRGYLIGPGARLGPEVGDHLVNTDLSYRSLVGVNFSGLRLVNANLTGANLTGANLTGANLTGVISGGITGTPTSLPTDWKLIRGYLIGPGADLKNANLTGANLTGASLGGANLTGVISGGITGTPTSLPTDWKLIRGNLIGPGADLKNANLTGANLTGANLTGANLTGVISGGITGTPTSLPTDWKLIRGYLIGPGADLASMVLSNANIDGANLAGATLTKAMGRGLTGTPTSLPTGWKLINGYLLGPTANLRDADLRNLDLTGVKLTGANLDGVQLSGAQLTGVMSGGVEGKIRTLPPLWVYDNGYLIGPGADITGADLSKWNLTFLQGGPVIGLPKGMPLGWNLVHGYFVGPGARLTNAMLENADLSSTDLSGADLVGANLRNANLSHADLSGARLMRADVDGANFEGATLPLGNMSSMVGVPGNLPDSWLLVDGQILRSVALSWGIEISGPYQVGQALSANFTGTPDPGTSYTFNWLLDGVHIAAGSATYWVDQADFGKQISVEVSGTKTGYVTVKKTSTTVTIEAGAQTLTPTPSVTGVSQVGQALTSAPGTWDSGVTLTYQWLRDGVAISGATKDTFLLTADDNTKQISVEVTGTKPGYATVKQTSSTVTIEAGAQTLTPTPIVTGTSKVGQTLTATPGNWDSGVTLTYQWLRDGVAISGAIKSTLQLTADDNTKQISVEVTGTKTGYVTVKKTSTTVKIDAGAQTLTPTPSVTGVSQVGQALTSTPGTWDSGVALTYQWSRDGLPITGATNPVLSLVANDFGKLITVEITGTKLGYVTVKRTSTATKIEAGTMAATTPKITGIAKVGVTLKVIASSWAKGSKVTYKWLANGAAIKGATSSSLKLTSAMKGKRITVVVTQMAAGYTTISKTSAAITVK